MMHPLQLLTWRLILLAFEMKARGGQDDIKSSGGVNLMQHASPDALEDCSLLACDVIVIGIGLR